MRAARWASLGLLVVAAGCARYAVEVQVRLPEDGPEVDRLELSVFEPAQPIENFCDRFAFGELDPQSLSGALAGFVPDLREAGDVEVKRAEQKLFVLRGFAGEVERLRGCQVLGDVGAGDTVVELEALPVTRLTVELDIEVLEPGARGDRVLFVRVDDPAGEPVDGTPLRARRCSASGACEDSEFLFTPGADGTMRLRPDRAPAGPFRLELASRFGNRRISGVGMSLPDPEDLLGLVHPLRRPVEVGGGLGFAAWTPGAGLEIGVLEDGQLRNITADERSVFTVLPSAVGLDGPEPMVPVVLTDGTLQLVDGSLATRGPEGALSLPADLTGVNVLGPFPTGACELGAAAPFFVQVDVNNAPFSTARYGGLGGAPPGAVIGSFCSEVEGVGPTRFLELNNGNERAIFLPGPEQSLPAPSFRTANVERRRADGGADLVYAHLLPPLNELRLDTIDAILDDDTGLRFAPREGGAPTPGIVFALAAGSVTGADVVERDGVEELVFIVGEVELFPEFQLLEGARLGVVSGALDEEIGMVATVDLPECAFAVSCALALGDVDGDGADEILLGRSDFGDGLARSLVIDLSP